MLHQARRRALHPRLHVARRRRPLLRLLHTGEHACVPSAAVEAAVDAPVDAAADIDLGRRQCEARHFIHLYMQHLSIVVWKFEPAEEKSA